MAAKDNDLSVDTYIPISSLVVDKTYHQTFLVDSATYLDVRGSKFIKTILKDASGEINGAIWGYIDGLIDGTFIKLKLETKIYKGELSFNADAADVIILDEPPINQHDYIKGVSSNILSLYTGKVEAEITSLSDPIYRDILCNAMHRLDLLAALRGSPYGINDSMAYPGGLLVHVVHSLGFAKIACKQATELAMPFNPSLVIAGCLLRNIGWHTTTKFQGGILRSRDAYRMTGIYRASARYIDHLMLTCEGDLQIIIPEPKKQSLENMCNTRENIHSLEGQIVSCADNMADVLDFGNATLQRKRIGNWINNELFVGHL